MSLALIVFVSKGRSSVRPKVSPGAIRQHLAAGHGILKVAALVGVGSGTVQRVKRELVAELAAAFVGVRRVPHTSFTPSARPSLCP